LRDSHIAFGVFAFVFLTHSVSPNATSSDSHWIVLQMHSILAEHNLDLDEYPQELKRHRYNALECVDGAGRTWRPSLESGCGRGRTYGWYPIGAAVVSLPVFAGLDAALRVAGPLVTPRLAGASPVVRGIFARDYVVSYPLVEMVIGSFLMGLAAAILYLLARVWLTTGPSLLLAFLFAYGTPAWSTGSRALWQHGPDMLAIVCALYLAARGRIVWSALPAALAFFIRPTSCLVVAAFGLYVLLHHRRRFPAWAALAAGVALCFLAYNLHLYGTPLPTYFQLSSSLSPPAAEALAGHCFSPSRGFFVFSPFLLFSLAGMAVALRGRWAAPLSWYLVGLAVSHWLLISGFPDWTAGYSFGPRYFSDMTPVFVFFLIPLLAPGGLLRRSRSAAALFILLAAVAVWIHYRGAAVWAVQRWNDGGRIEERVWDWRDPQFLRGL